MKGVRGSVVMVDVDVVQRWIVCESRGSSWSLTCCCMADCGVVMIPETGVGMVFLMFLPSGRMMHDQHQPEKRRQGCRALSPPWTLVRPLFPPY